MIGMNENNQSVAPPPLPAGTASAQSIKTAVHRRLLETMDLTQARKMPREQLQQECSRRVDQLLNEQACPLSAPGQKKVVSEGEAERLAPCRPVKQLSTT